ncbi:MAG: esterase-like activity of phytase family protein [Pseudomonadota bacterium]|nr:esterase-like activity of phytase family protein [Pseudomonadota bacterium]
MRIALAVLAAGLAAVTAAFADEDIPVPLNGDWRAVDIQSASYQLRGDAAPEKPLRAGSLIYRGGAVLTSSDPAFGGFSGIVVSEDGAQLTAISDRGQWLEAALDYDADGRLAGAHAGRMSAITDKDGVVLAGSIADAESLSLSGDGRLFVSFEREHRIDAYRIDDEGKIVFDFRFAEFNEDAPPYNDGVESVTVLDDGVLALSEKPFASGANGFFFTPDGPRLPVRYSDKKDYAVTEAARLDGDLFILERAFSRLKGVRARLLRAPLPSAGDLAMKADLLAQLSPPFVVDNMEGLDVRRGPHGETLLYVMSDDNFSSRQKTILLLFEVAP